MQRYFDVGPQVQGSRIDGKEVAFDADGQNDKANAEAEVERSSPNIRVQPLSSQRKWYGGGSACNKCCLCVPSF